MFDTIIFDFDNTLEQWLVPETEAKVEIATELSKKYQFNVSDFLQKWREVDNNPSGVKREDTVPWDFSRERRFQVLFKGFNIPEDPKKFEKKYWNIMNKKVSLFPNVKKTLDELKKRGIRMIILSDSGGAGEDKTKRIEILGIKKYFDFIFTSNDFGMNKPNRKIYDEIIKRTGLDPKKTISIGDDPLADLFMCKKLGMATVWDQESFAFDKKIGFVDYVVKDIFEIVGIIDKLNALPK
ncbi:MAG: HAD family hydrolase [Candidatus Woesearchaeota archaeon]